MNKPLAQNAWCALCLTLGIAQVSLLGCGSGEPSVACDELPLDCYDASFAQLAAGCLQVEESLADAAKRWQARTREASRTPSYVFILTETSRYEYFEAPEEEPDVTMDVFRIVVEDGVMQSQSGSTRSPPFRSVEQFFEELATGQCLIAKDAYEVTEVSPQYDRTSGYPTSVSYGLQGDQGHYLYTWEITCVAVGQTDASACPLPGA